VGCVRTLKSINRNETGKLALKIRNAPQHRWGAIEGTMYSVLRFWIDLERAHRVADKKAIWDRMVPYKEIFEEVLLRREAVPSNSRGGTDVLFQHAKRFGAVLCCVEEHLQRTKQYRYHAVAASFREFVIRQEDERWRRRQRQQQRQQR
jgi:hypothetical protein